MPATLAPVFGSSISKVTVTVNGATAAEKDVAAALSMLGLDSKFRPWAGGVAGLELRASRDLLS
eukprot:2209384-Prymnesium_polylepis.1